MLVFTRKLGEAITIGDPKTGDPKSAEKAIGNQTLIEVTVEEIGAGSVRLGITAPKETTVHRSEVWEDIQANGRRKEEEAS